MAEISYTPINSPICFFILATNGAAEAEVEKKRFRLSARSNKKRLTARNGNDRNQQLCAAYPMWL